MGKPLSIISGNMIEMLIINSIKTDELINLSYNDKITKYFCFGGQMANICADGR